MARRRYQSFKGCLVLTLDAQRHGCVWGIVCNGYGERRSYENGEGEEGCGGGPAHLELLWTAIM